MPRRGAQGSDLTTAKGREARGTELKALFSNLAVRPLTDDVIAAESDEADANEALMSSSAPQLNQSKKIANNTTTTAAAATATATAATTTTTAPHRPFAGGGAIITSSGRPVVLSAGSRRLPAVFREQQSLTRGIDVALADVQQTLKSLNYDFSKTKEATVPAEMLQAVEADHNAYLNALEMRKRGGGSGAGNAKVRRPRHGGGGGGGASEQDGTGASNLDFTGNNADNRHGCTEQQWLHLVRQARDAAADEGHDESQSVENYAAEPDVPRSLQGQTLRSLLSHAEEDCEKLISDLDVLNATTSSRDTVWWDSALLTRDVKARTIRANYHARRAQRWTWRARESMLLQTTHLNKFSDQNRADLVRLQEQLAAFTARVQKSEATTAALQKEFVELQTQSRAAANDRTRWQEELTDLAQARGLLHTEDNDALRAEVLLLLQQLRWPSELCDHVVRVMNWIREHPVLLEV